MTTLMDASTLEKWRECSDGSEHTFIVFHSSMVILLARNDVCSFLLNNLVFARDKFNGVSSRSRSSKTSDLECTDWHICTHVRRRITTWMPHKSLNLCGDRKHATCYGYLLCRCPPELPGSTSTFAQSWINVCSTSLWFCSHARLCEKILTGLTCEHSQ